MSRELIRYTDTDGDEIVVAIDPVDDTGEDVLVIVRRYDGHALAARLSLQALRDVVAKTEELS
jgi:hypothetical protein